MHPFLISSLEYLSRKIFLGRFPKKFRRCASFPRRQKVVQRST